MAEIASNVLHNVGNVLNSVNVSINLVTGRARRSRTASLAKVVALLKERADLESFNTTGPGRGATLLLELPHGLSMQQRKSA
jgi:hypothetical protein